MGTETITIIILLVIFLLLQISLIGLMKDLRDMIKKQKDLVPINKTTNHGIFICKK